MSNWSYNAGSLVLWVLIAIVAFCWFKFPKKGDELIVAASHNDTNGIVRLLSSGVSVDYATKSEKKTALMMASAKGGTEAVEFLLRMGADKNVKDIVARTAFDYALANGHTNLLELLK